MLASPFMGESSLPRPKKQANRVITPGVPLYLFYCFGFVEQPAVDKIGHCPQSFIGYAFPIDACHIVPCMPHDGIDRDLIPALPGNGLEGMAQGVKISMSVDAD